MSEENKSLMMVVANNIISDVLSGVLKPDDILLSKRALAAKYNVSRTVIDRSLNYLQEKGYVDFVDGHVKIIQHNRFKNFEDLANFAIFDNQTFSESEVEQMRKLKIGLDMLAIRLMPTPISDENYYKLKLDLSSLKLTCENCGNKKCNNCAEILYNFYSELARMSDNVFLQLLYSSFRKPNIDIISHYIKEIGIKTIFNKAMTILDCIHDNKKEEALRLLDSCLE